MQMQWQEHTKCSSPSLSNSNKATNAYGGIREEEQGNHKGVKSFTPESHQKKLMLMGGEERKNKGEEPQSNSKI